MAITTSVIQNPTADFSITNSPGTTQSVTPLSPATQQQNTQLTPQQDIRVRLSALNPGAVYGTATSTTVGQASPSSIGIGASPASSPSAPLWSLLNQTNGMLFPYTPTISFTEAVNYMDLQLVHSNTDYAAYTRTPSVSISISGKFTVQNQTEGMYSLACIHFLRTVSKSYFGEFAGPGSNQPNPNAGLPPPILLLNGYGNYIFNNLAVILKSHNWSFDDSADGIDIVFGTNRARLPALFTISCELQVVQTPQRMRKEFTFQGFASGALMQPSSTPGWI